ncbi:MAG: hypothetical protein LBJ72_10355 [Dysgonamonadaceae bacterium]|jgi:hypothetical protein|nr:hypothetical protein [Dysgonamonadaceae bacterium]
MKKCIIIFCSLFVFSPLLKAGDGDYYVSLSGGFLHYKAMSYELTLEKTLRYHHAWEMGLDYYNQTFSRPIDASGKRFRYQALLFEGAYKYNLVRYRNANLRFRGAAGIGVNERDRFTLSLSPGFEYTYTCPSNIQLFIQEKTQFSFWTANHSWFRAGIMIGIKIPLRFN